jgi:NHL repeat
MSARTTIRRLALTGLSTLTVLAGCFAVEAAPGVAFGGHLPAPTSQFGKEGSGNGEFTHPTGVAVDEASGDVYVLDSGNNRVEKFDAEGNYLSQFNSSETPTGSFLGPAEGAGASIVVDNSAGPRKGDVYITEIGTEGRFATLTDVFDSSGKYVTQIPRTPVVSAPVDSAGNFYEVEENTSGFAVLKRSVSSGEVITNWDEYAHAVTVNPSTNDVLVDREEIIEEYGPFGEPFAEPFQVFATTGLSESYGIAVNGKTGTVYATEKAAGNVDIFKAVVFPNVSAVTASSLTKTSEELHGVVGPENVPITSCQFEWASSSYYKENASYEQSMPCTQSVPFSSGASVPVSAQVSGLQGVGGTYDYRLVTSNGNGVTTSGHDQTFVPLIVRATVNDLPPSVSDISRTAGLVSGTINPEELETVFYVEYGTSTSYGAQTSPAGAGAGGVDEPVGPAVLSGLRAGTTYHYRIVASNQAGVTIGPDYTFATSAAIPPIVSTAAAGSVGQTSAILSGTVNSQGLPTSYMFEIGTDASYGGAQLFGNAGDTAADASISASLEYLVPGTTYHYRLVATNEDGTTYGQDVVFTTAGVSDPIVQPPATPLLAVPNIVFPKEEKGSTGTSTKTLTKAEKLKHALRTCEKEKKSKKRSGCKAAAHKKLGSGKKKGK